MNLDADALIKSVRLGDRRSLAQAITLVESTRTDHRAIAVDLLERLTPHAGKAIRIGISGVPGVGKSTFIEAFGLHVLDGQVSLSERHQVAVLSIDPSSAISGGSILGDKTRMENLSRHPRAFIRPSPSRGTLGGVARRTREAMLLCEAAGFDVVIVETVGVGQSEFAVADMVDIFVLLVSPTGGDELQGIKRGIMELADLVLVNKADGELLPAARQAAADYRLAIGLMQPRSKQWKVPVELCSALTGEGIAQTWRTVCHYYEMLSATGELNTRRAAQARNWMWKETTEALLAALKEHPEVRRHLVSVEAEVASGRLPATIAAQKLLELFMNC